MALTTVEKNQEILSMSLEDRSSGYQDLISDSQALLNTGQIIFGKLAELWRREYVEKIAAGRPMVAAPTRAKYVAALENHILPRWKDARIAELRARDVLEWLQEEATSWHMMSDLRGVMSGIITKAIEWEILPETFANPIASPGAINSLGNHCRLPGEGCGS